MALTDGILAYWKLDDSGWTDATGNGYTLTDAGGTPVPTGTGIINSGAVSDGSQQYLKNDTISVGSSYSVSLWVNVISDLGLDCVWNLGGHDGPAGVANNTNAYFFLGNVDGDKDLPNINGLPTGWNHLCYVIDNDAQTQAFYLNGDYQNGNDYAGNFGGWNGFELGAFSGRGLFSNSHLDEVGIWDRALTQGDITFLYNLGNAIQYPFGVLYYNNAQEDGDWGNLGNWWLDSAYSTQSTYLPTTETHIVVAGNITQNTFFRSVTISGTDNDGTYTRNNIGEGFVFNDWSINYNGGTSYSLYNGVDIFGTSTDNCQTWSSDTYTITTTNRNFDCVCHDAQFNSVNFATGLVLNSSGVVNMQGSSVFSGTATDSISLHDTSYIDTTAIIGGNATFRDSSVNTGTINGNAYVYYDGGNGQFPIGGYVDGSVSYLGWPAYSPQYFNDSQTEDGDFNNPLNWWTNQNYDTRPINSVGTQVLPDPSTDIFVVGYEILANTGSAAACNTATFVNYGILSISLTCSNGATFNNGVLYAITYGSGQVVGNAVFNGDSYQIGYVTGNAKFTSNASLNNSFNYQSSWAGLSPTKIGSFTAAVKSKKPISISSLLGFPWFINF
jgi:hypothetical protein